LVELYLLIELSSPQQQACHTYLLAEQKPLSVVYLAVGKQQRARLDASHLIILKGF
jgi:hypothetical protein